MPRYQSSWSCGEIYVSELVRNVVLNWAKHEDPNKQSETANYFSDFVLT